jgi:hypothetical protein
MAPEADRDLVRRVLECFLTTDERRHWEHVALLLEEDECAELIPTLHQRATRIIRSTQKPARGGP